MCKIKFAILFFYCLTSARIISLSIKRNITTTETIYSGMGIKCHTFCCHHVAKSTAIKTYGESTSNCKLTEKNMKLNPQPTISVKSQTEYS